MRTGVGSCGNGATRRRYKVGTGGRTHATIALLKYWGKRHGGLTVRSTLTHPSSCEVTLGALANGRKLTAGWLAWPPGGNSTD